MTKKKKTVRPHLIVERNKETLWGTTKVNDNLIVDYATSLEILKKKMRKLILHFEKLEVEDFDVSYDVSAFFDEFPYVSISHIATKSGINYSLMRQYSMGNKYPSEVRVKVIERTIREIGKELTKVRLHKPEKKAA